MINNKDEMLIELEKVLNFLQTEVDQGNISQDECDDLLDFDNNPIEAYKIAFKKRHLIKCSILMLEIYDQHKESFRNAVMLSDCIPDPLSMNYSNDTHDFCIRVLNRSYEIAKQKKYPQAFLDDLYQIYSIIKMLHHNNVNNTKLLNENKFSSYSLSEQLRMICIYLQDQSRLVNKIHETELSKKRFTTGMEMAVANRSVNYNPSMKMSISDSFEALFDSFDTLIRYLYYKKRKELKIDITELIKKHEGITHLYIPSFEEIEHISSLRVIYTGSWEKFKYAQWQIAEHQDKNNTIYLLRPKFVEKYRQHIIASMRRNYVKLLYIYRNRDDNESKILYNKLINIAENIDVTNIRSLYKINKGDYNNSKDFFKVLINAYENEFDDYILNNHIHNTKVRDIIKFYEFLQTISKCYEIALYKYFDEDNCDHYKYLAPIVSITELASMFSNFSCIEKNESLNIINMFIFDDKSKGETNIFCKPLLYVAKDSILFSRVFIEQMNLDRTIEMLFLQHDIDLSPIGRSFEKQLRTIMSLIPSIQVNTEKIEFKAYDGRDVEFDFLGTFGSYLLLIEIKSMITPYDDKRLHNNESTIKFGVEQVVRRSLIVQNDWEQLRSRCNINLPDKPFDDKNIIKLVVTNLFDFTTIKYSDVEIIDESTLLRFFASPFVEVVNVGSKKVVASRRIWKGNLPTVDEFIDYLHNPITISPYNGCFESKIKAFRMSRDDYQVAIIDEVLVKDPYSKIISEAFETSNGVKKIGRNDPCICGREINGKPIKYKNCCGKQRI